MKSLKKRFKQQLSLSTQRAAEWALLTADIDLLASAQASAQAVVNACIALQQQTATLDKADFAAEISQATALVTLEEWVDRDEMSILENSLFSALDRDADETLQQFFGQLLDKLDRQHALLVGAIQPLLELLSID